MILPVEPKVLSDYHFDVDTLRGHILNRRNAIRKHRDAKGDDRCWLDDYIVWEFVENLPTPPTNLWPIEYALDLCADFYKTRRSETPDPVPTDAITDPAIRDKDLDTMTQEELLAELVRIQIAINSHCRVGEGFPTIQDDRELYRILPEKLPADFRLPPKEDFLGEALAPNAGCPSFWRSHKNCGTCPHNLHQWGPCKP